MLAASSKLVSSRNYTTEICHLANKNTKCLAANSGCTLQHKGQITWIYGIHRRKITFATFIELTGGYILVTQDVTMSSVTKVLEFTCS